jgi:hypothetical protein
MSEHTTATNGNKKTRKTQVPANESKDDAFKRLALKRVNACMAKGRQIKNLARYPHTDEQAKKIIDQITMLADEIEEAFSPREKNEEFKF